MALAQAWNVWIRVSKPLKNTFSSAWMMTHRCYAAGIRYCDFQEMQASPYLAIEQCHKGPGPFEGPPVKLTPDLSMLVQCLEHIHPQGVPWETRRRRGCAYVPNKSHGMLEHQDTVLFFLCPPAPSYMGFCLSFELCGRYMPRVLPTPLRDTSTWASLWPCVLSLRAVAPGLVHILMAFLSSRACNLRSITLSPQFPPLQRPCVPHSSPCYPFF